MAGEPMRLRVRRYGLTLPGWRRRLRVAVLADIHACRPWMTAGWTERIVRRANALAPHLTLLLGDQLAFLPRPGGRAT